MRLSASASACAAQALAADQTISQNFHLYSYLLKAGLSASISACAPIGLQVPGRKSFARAKRLVQRTMHDRNTVLPKPY